MGTPKILEGRYQVDTLLGVGGQGRVFRGHDLVTKKPVAIKLMDVDQEDNPEAVGLFIQEGRLAARIRDPHLVSALHFGVSDGQRFIIYDYIPRVAPLTSYLDRGRADPVRVCDLALQILDALDTLHEAGVVHQDVSPANCLWRERESGRLEVFLADLGCAASRTPITGAPRRTDDPMGTAYFMAPEMWDGEGRDHRADLWSLGAVMYVLLTGCEVDRGTDDEPLEIPAPALLVPTIPPAISDAVMGALVSVELRYPSAVAMAEAVRAASAGLTIAPDRSPQRRKIPLWLGLSGMAAAALLAALGAVGAVRALEAEPPAMEPAQLPASMATELTASLPPTTPKDPIASLPPIAASLPTASLPPVAASLPPASPPPVAASPPTASLPRRPLKAADSSAPALTWPKIESAVKGKATELRRCSSDDSISLGLKVAGGRASLESFDGKPVSLKLANHRCASDVLRGLRFAREGRLSGVVGVVLD